MGLPNSYTQKPVAIPAYFQAILDAQPPERFSIKFLENIGFASTNDRLFLSILKELGFLNADGTPQQRYFDYLDRSQSGRVLADGIRVMYSDLFAVNKQANELSIEDVKNKLRTLYAGKKTELVISHIAKTFAAALAAADFSAQTPPAPPTDVTPPDDDKVKKEPDDQSQRDVRNSKRDTPLSLESLQYHINIVLPESRDQAVYDAIFKSLRDHLG